jgi:hypothetical protein
MPVEGDEEDVQISPHVNREAPIALGSAVNHPKPRPLARHETTVSTPVNITSPNPTAKTAVFNRVPDITDPLIDADSTAVKNTVADHAVVQTTVFNRMPDIAEPPVDADSATVENT